MNSLCLRRKNSEIFRTILDTKTANTSSRSTTFRAKTNTSDAALSVICERSNEGRLPLLHVGVTRKSQYDLPKLLPSGSESNGLLSPTFFETSNGRVRQERITYGKIKHPAKNSQNGRYSCSVRNCILIKKSGSVTEELCESTPVTRPAIPF